MNPKIERWEDELASLSARAVEHLRSKLSVQMEIEVLHSHQIVHVSDTVDDERELTPMRVSLAIHLAKAEDQPTVAILTVSNSVTAIPENLRKLRHLLDRFDALAAAASDDPELKRIGVLIQHAIANRRTECIRVEEAEYEAIQERLAAIEKKNDERRLVLSLQGRRKQALALAERIDLRLRTMNP